MTTTDVRTPEQLQYLEFIQNIIARHHDSATSIKRLALVGFALGGAMARYLHEPIILGVSVAVVVASWWLDAKYLQTERGYRRLYNSARVATEEAVSFDLTPPRGDTLWKAIVSWSVLTWYLPMLCLLALLAVLWGFADWKSGGINGYQTESVLQLPLSSGRVEGGSSQEHGETGGQCPGL